MSSVWECPAGVGLSNTNGNLVGFDVEATDGHIGRIDEASVVTGQAHLVVDTGSWIYGKKRMIPAGVVQSIDVQDETVYVRLSKEEIRSAPDFDAQRRDDREDYDTYYDPFWP
jgi:hypothetical protein